MFDVSLGDKVYYSSWGKHLTGAVVAIHSANILWVCDDETGKVRWMHRDSVTIICNAVELLA
jgi:hypothetical protein